MATLYGMLAAMERSVVAATTGLTSSAPDTAGDPLNVEVGIGWPAEKTLQDNVRAAPNPSALVSIYDRGMGRDVTRWLSREVSRTVTPATVTAQASAPYIGPFATGQITIGGTVTSGDAIAVMLATRIGQASAQVVSPSTTDTPATIATAIAAAIQGDTILNKMVTATAAGAVVTLTSITTDLTTFAVNVGNGGTRTSEVGRRNRDVQIVIWTRTEDDRNTVGDAIEATIAQLEADFGLTFSDGSVGRVLYQGDRQFDDSTLADTYRRDFFASVDYPITVTDALYAVLAPIPRNTTL